MKKTILIFTFLVAGILVGCQQDDDHDKVKTVNMTIYSEIGYGGPVMSDVIYEQMIFSESDDQTKRLLSDIITEGFDFDYEIGNEYTFKAKKTWMSNPPQDASNVKYEVIGPITTTKVLIEDAEEELTLSVKPDLVEFVPRFSEPKATEEQTIYEAMNCVNKEDEKTVIIKEIDGFDFEEGYQYELRVKRTTTASPYSQVYKLIEIIHKDKA